MKKSKLFIAILFLVIVSQSFGVTVQAGYNADATTEIAMRTRNFAHNENQSSPDGGELYLGVDGLGDGGNRVEADYGYNGHWLLDTNVNYFRFEYDKINTAITIFIQDIHHGLLFSI